MIVQSDNDRVIYKNKFEEKTKWNKNFEIVMKMFFKYKKLPFDSAKFKFDSNYATLAIPEKLFGVFSPIFQFVDISVRQSTSTLKDFDVLDIDYRYTHPSGGSNGVQVGTVFIFKKNTSEGKKGEVILREPRGNPKTIGNIS